MPDHPPARVSLIERVLCRREFLGLALIFACITWFYAYIGIPPQYAIRFAKDDGDYYNQLADGFLAGRLGFKIDPPQALIALRDPYDPVQRQQTGIVELHDATYYKGRYYLYFGAAPALTLFLPFKVLSGLHFPQNLATVVFCAGGYLGSLGLLCGLRRRFFPRTTTGWVWIAAIMLGLGNFCAPMLARNSVWEVPIASAYFYSAGGFWLLFNSLTGRTGRLCWLAGASTAFGLTVASRPHFVFGAVVLFGLWAARWIWRWRRGDGGARTQWLRETGAVVLPLGLIVGGLLLYNYARFDNPFEFGQKYQLAGNRQVDSQLVSFRFFRTNFYLNFLAPAQIERYFPFFQLVRGYPGVRPVDYGGAEDPYGVLPNMPVAWLALLAPVWWMLGFRRERALGGWLLIFGLTFFALAAAVMCFAWSANRYMVDFIPDLLLVAMLGLLMVSRRAESSRPWRILGRIGVVAAVAYTAVFNLLVTIQHNDLFKSYRPETFAVLADWFNQPAKWWERNHAPPYGPVELTVKFPRDQLGKAEPLMVTGVSYKSDFLYVLYYPNTHQVRLAFAHTGGRQLLSQFIPVDYGRPHRIGIAAGSLYPLAANPFFSGWSKADVQAAKRTLCVTLDGVPYLTAESEFYETSPGFVTFGQNNVSDYIERKFTGEMREVRRQPLAPAINGFSGGNFVRLGLELPRQAAGRREPLVVTGAADQQDLFFITYISDEIVRFGLHHAGAEPLLSPPVAIKPGDLQVLEASLGSFYPNPKNARERELAQLLVVRLNGQTLWVVPQAFYPAGGQRPVIGRNLPGSDGYAVAFSGRIVAQEAAQPFPAAPLSPFVLPPYWLESAGQPAYGAMRLLLALPAQPAPKLEPLLVTGSTAILADYVTITYPLPGQLSLGYVHAGTGGPQSPRMRVDATHRQIVEIDVPSLYPSEGDDFFATRTLSEIALLKRNHARIKLNGRILFDTPVPAFDSAAAQITVGVDRLAQAFGSHFSGQILAVERISLQPPEGLTKNIGPLELTFVFPDSPLAGDETLFATGDGRTMDSLLVHYDQPGRVRFAVKTAGGASLTSPPIPVDSATHVLRLFWGGLNPDEIRPKAVSPEDWHQSQRTIKVLLDGTTLLEGQAEFVLATPQIVMLEGTPLNGDAFSGRLKSVQRLP